MGASVGASVEAPVALVSLLACSRRREDEAAACAAARRIWARAFGSVELAAESKAKKPALQRQKELSSLAWAEGGHRLQPAMPCRGATFCPLHLLQDDACAGLK